MAYTVELSRPAERDLERLERDLARRIRAALEFFRPDPRTRGSIKLSGETDLYRIRVGAYRIVYEIDDGKRRAVVLRIQHRREAYR